jgi:hypothetical protein
MKRIFLVPVLLLWCSTTLAATPPDLPSNAERLTGEAALAHLNQLKAKHGAAFAAAARMMEQRGFHPTDVVNVLRSKHLTRSQKSPLAPGVDLAQTTYSDSDGEVTMWSWDDGDPNTWEGVVYLEDYSSGSNGTFNTQVDISQQNYSTYWEQTVSYTSGGGGCVDCKKYTSTPFGIRERPTLIASASRGAIFTDPAIMLAQSGGRMRNFIFCAGGGCIGAAVSCISAGPAWPSCFLWRCAGVIVGCAVNALK